MLITLLFLIYSVKAFINPQESAVVSDFTNCLTQLIEDNFKESGFIHFVSTANDSTTLSNIKLEVLEKISAKLKYKVQIVTSTNQKSACEGDYGKLGVFKRNQQEATPSPDYYLIILENYKEFSYIVENIICFHNWNPYARFIILLFKFSHDYIIKNNLENIFTYLFQHNALRVAIVVPQRKKVGYSTVYSWKPLDPPKYCGYFNESAENRLLIKNVCDHGIVKHNRDLFMNHIPLDMKGCTLNVLALVKHPFVSENINDPNIEIDFINQIVTQFNFKMNYEIIRTHRGEKEKNGKWSGALKLLVSKQGHMLFGGIYPAYDVHQDFECSTTYLIDSYTWVVPRATISPKWRALIIIFNKSVWILIVGSFVISVLSWRILGKLSNDSPYNQDLNHCFLNALISAIGFSNYTRPIKNSLRVFCVFFSIHCLLLLTAYQTKLTAVLHNHFFEYQIQTTEELVTSGLKFGGYEHLHELFVNTSDPLDNYLEEQWIDVDDIRKALLDVAIHKNFSVLCSRLELAQFSTFMPELRDQLGYKNYYAFEKTVFTVPIESISLRGFAFIPDFSKMLDYFKQNGMTEAIRKQLAIFNMKQQAKQKQKKKSDFKALSVRDLQGGFLVLVLGYIGGMIILCIETLINIYRISF